MLSEQEMNETLGQTRKDAIVAGLWDETTEYREAISEMISCACGELLFFDNDSHVCTHNGEQISLQVAQNIMYDICPFSVIHRFRDLVPLALMRAHRFVVEEYDGIEGVLAERACSDEESLAEPNLN